MLTFRRFAALLAALFLFQIAWQGSGAACVGEHAGTMHGWQAAASEAPGAAGTVVGVHSGAELAHRGSGTVTAGAPSMDMAGMTSAPPSADGGEMPPSHGPDAATPVDCAAMLACSVANATELSAAVLALEVQELDARVPERNVWLHSRATTPDVPPPRA